MCYNWVMEENNLKDNLQTLELALKKKAQIAYMNEIVASTSDKPIVGTVALATCYGIVFYDRKHKLGIVGHASSSKLLDILDEMMTYFTIDKEITIEYAIIPGYDNVLNNHLEGLNILEDYLIKNTPMAVKLVPFKGIDLFVHEELGSYSFAFNALNGLPVTKYLFYSDNEGIKRLK